MKGTILKLLKACHRRRHIPDLHSFRAEIKGGVVFVDCSVAGNCVDVHARMYDEAGMETREYWTGPMTLAADMLERLGLDLATVET